VSANNILIIRPVKSHIVVDEWEACEMMAEEGSEGTPIFKADSVEDAIRKAEAYMQEEIVEFGYRICFPKNDEEN